MMHTHLKLFVLVPVLMGCFGAGQISTPPPTPRSDRQQEDAVARLFDEVRKEAKLHHLIRIEDRTSLQQLVCTIAATDKVPRFRSGFPVLGNGSVDGVKENDKQDGSPKADTASALYRTSNPGEVLPELRRVALYERPRGRSGHSPGYKRYAVSVWPTRQPTGEKIAYWVAVQLFWSEGSEFFQNHSTDAIEWKNEWKALVAPECKGVS